MPSPSLVFPGEGQVLRSRDETGAKPVHFYACSDEQTEMMTNTTHANVSSLPLAGLHRLQPVTVIPAHDRPRTRQTIDLERTHNICRDSQPLNKFSGKALTSLPTKNLLEVVRERPQRRRLSILSLAIRLPVNYITKGLRFRPHCGPQTYSWVTAPCPPGVASRHFSTSGKSPSVSPHRVKNLPHSSTRKSASGRAKEKMCRCCGDALKVFLLLLAQQLWYAVVECRNMRSSSMPGRGIRVCMYEPYKSSGACTRTIAVSVAIKRTITALS